MILYWIEKRSDQPVADVTEVSCRPILNGKVGVEVQESADDDAPAPDDLLEDQELGDLLDLLLCQV